VNSGENPHILEDPASAEAIPAFDPNSAARYDETAGRSIPPRRPRVGFHLDRSVESASVRMAWIRGRRNRRRVAGVSPTRGRPLRKEAMKNHMTLTTRPAKLGKRRILVVANEIVDGGALRDVIGLRADGEPPAEVLVIAPALNSRLRHWLSDGDEARRGAGLRLAASLEHLSVAGIEAEGLVGDADPLQAITDALYEFGAHEIVIATHPESRSHWLTRDLVGRARRRFAQAIVHVVVEPSEDSMLRVPAPGPAGPEREEGRGAPDRRVCRPR
jgi:hypothetical protein